MLNDEPESIAALDIPVQVDGLDHVATMVVDIDAAVDWYVRVLGASVKDRWADADSGMAWAHLEVGGAPFEFVQRQGLTDADRSATGAHHVALRVADCDSAVRALAASGGEIVVPPTYFARHHMDWSFVRDPFGLVLELISHRPVDDPEERP